MSASVASCAPQDWPTRCTREGSPPFCCAWCSTHLIPVLQSRNMSSTVPCGRQQKITTLLSKQLLREAQDFLSFTPKTKNLLNPKGTRKQDASPALCVPWKEVHFTL